MPRVVKTTKRRGSEVIAAPKKEREESATRRERILGEDHLSCRDKKRRIGEKRSPPWDAAATIDLSTPLP
jgi:hypothetical protein